MKRSAGILLYRRRPGEGELAVLLVHMGGPFWQHRDEGSWSIPKGEYEAQEDPLAAARREFAEELGTEAPAGDPIPLGEARQPGGKVITAYALEGDLDADGIRSNLFEIEWPRGSGRRRQFPEVDRAQWFGLEAARSKLLPGQRVFLGRLRVAADAPPGT
ncbi:MAG: NUDIX domain-containing protein [Gaiellales bacterium]